MYDIVAVYHGGTDIIQFPKVNVGRERLDFGPGFYMTDIFSQAKDWAYKMAERRDGIPILNTYHLHKKDMVKCCRGKFFEAYDKEWLEFVTRSRLGEAPWVGLDYVEGGVADDNVIDTIRLYMNGFISADDALQRLKYFRPANQICVLSQTVLDKFLTFIKADEI